MKPPFAGARVESPRTGGRSITEMNRTRIYDIRIYKRDILFVKSPTWFLCFAFHQCSAKDTSNSQVYSNMFQRPFHVVLLEQKNDLKTIPVLPPASTRQGMATASPLSTRSPPGSACPFRTPSGQRTALLGSAGLGQSTKPVQSHVQTRPMGLP